MCIAWFFSSAKIGLTLRELIIIADVERLRASLWFAMLLVTLVESTMGVTNVKGISLREAGVYGKKIEYMRVSVAIY